jgi:hypothetical protein
MYSGQYGAAAEKFRAAVVLAPLPKYYFNLGTAHYQEGKCGEARKALEHVLNSGADDTLKAKAQKMLERVSSC